MSIAIINTSVAVSDIDGQIMVSALNQLLPKFCSDWGLANHVAVFIPKGKTSTIPIKVFILDKSDMVGALGYHDLSSPIPYGKCFAYPILVEGGAVLYGSDKSVPTVSQCLSHEVFEILLDPLCNGWWSAGDQKTLFAREVGDPVEGNIILVNVILVHPTTYVNSRTRATVTKPAVTKTVTISDWILPAWSDPQNTIGPFNHLNTLTRPFTVDVGGYVIAMPIGKPITVRYGTGVTEDLRRQYELRHRLFKRTT